MKKYLLVELTSICLVYGNAAVISANTTSFTNLKVLAPTYLTVVILQVQMIIVPS